MSFFSFLVVLEIYQNSQKPFLLCFPLLCISPYSSLFISLFSFKYWRTFNTHVNQPCKLLSPPVLIDLTRFSLYAITEVSRKPKHTHFKYQFQNIYFLCAVFLRSNFGHLRSQVTDLAFEFNLPHRACTIGVEAINDSLSGPQSMSRDSYVLHDSTGHDAQRGS